MIYFTPKETWNKICNDNGKDYVGKVFKLGEDDTFLYLFLSYDGVIYPELNVLQLLPL